MHWKCQSLQNVEVGQDTEEEKKKCPLYDKFQQGRARKTHQNEWSCDGWGQMHEQTICYTDHSWTAFHLQRENRVFKVMDCG